MRQVVSVVSGGKTTDGKLISQSGVIKLYDRLLTIMAENNTSSAACLNVYLKGRGVEHGFRPNHIVGHVRNVMIDPNSVSLHLQLDLFGPGAAFYVKKERQAEFVLSGGINRFVGKRIWYAPWRKIYLIDDMLVDYVLMVVNTDK